MGFFCLVFSCKLILFGSTVGLSVGNNENRSLKKSLGEAFGLARCLSSEYSTDSGLFFEILLFKVACDGAAFTSTNRLAE